MTRPRVTALLAAALVALAAPPALAHGDSRYDGNCGFHTFAQDTLTGDTYTGMVYAAVAAYSTEHGNVVDATVTCQVRVDGEVAASATGSGTGLVLVADQVEFEASDTQTVLLCTVVDFTSDETPTAWDCGEATQLQVPPQEYVDLLDYVFDVFAYATSVTDPVVCEVLRALAPGVEPVTIGPDGDVYLAGEWFWDCPPYQWSPPPDGLPGLPPQLPGPLHLSGAGYNDGSAGFLTLVAAAGPMSSTCGFTVRDGVATVTGRAGAPGAGTTTVGCRIEDATTGAPLYARSVTAAGGSAVLRDTFAATGPLTVCTQGGASYADHSASVGDHCRAGAAL